MNAELLSRVQFALTASFHFIYPPISMGLGLMLVVMGILYVRTKDPKWRQLSFFWTSVYGLVFAVGVATGVVQEFEFGMNWANYSRFVGNVFGSLLAAEGILAFFMEGSFLGLMLLGGNRLGPRMWLLATCLVVFGAHFSAIWIIMANSWMQTPAGYTVQAIPAPARAYMTDFWQVLFTPSFIPRLLHVWVSSWTVGSAIMLGVSSWFILRKRHLELATANFRLALAFFVVLAAVNLFVTGRSQVEEVLRSQPIKFAAMEGLWKTQTCAPMTIIGWVDSASQRTIGIKIPCLASILAFFNPNAQLTGLDAFISKEAIPPINFVFQTYHLMINLGVAYVGIGLLGVLLLLWKRKVFEIPLVLWLFVVTAFLTEVSIIAGWWTAEVGRQPWIVYKVMKTAEGVSPTLTTEQVALSLVTFCVLYIVLGALFMYLLIQKIQHGPEPLDKVETAPVSSLPDSLSEIFGRRPKDG
jgi:cytochrome d ubiquinol oxidase subunit I